MKELGKLTAIVLLLICGLLVTLLGTHIVLSVAQLYTLDFITRYSFVQVLGILFVISLIFTKYDHKKIEELSDITTNLIGKALALLLSWGIMTIIYYIVA